MTWRQYAGNFDNPINPEYEQEARLVEQSRAGSERAFSALLARYQQPVFRLIFYLVGDDEEARDLTRIAIKNALLHMPSVPAGYSIRPWLLRVAVLVALDAVRERSETPQQLLASLQLPPPPAPPRIVDADPSDTDTMELGVTRMENLANRPETAIADAWDELPVDVERELIRRLLSGLPEGDAELLALGVVGQIPTRDLAALAGTSQRSIRRRIARALILFQSRYYSVRQEALPAATAEKALPLTEAATSPIDIARRGLNEAGERVMRTLQGVRTGFGSTDAQERLQSLRTTNVPAAEVVADAPPPTTPRRSIPLPPPAQSQDFVDAEPTMPLPMGGDDAANQSTTDYADWTASVPSMDVPDLATAKPPSVMPVDQVTEPLPPSVIAMPPASAPYESHPQSTNDDISIPAPMPPESVVSPASASLTVLTEPLPAVAAEATTAIRPESAAPQADVAAVAPGVDAADITMPSSAADTVPTLVRPEVGPGEGATIPRRLPRFGPPPEEVITIASGLAVASEEAAAPSDTVEEPVSEVAAAPVAEEAIVTGDRIETPETTVSATDDSLDAVATSEAIAQETATEPEVAEIPAPVDIDASLVESPVENVAAEEASFNTVQAEADHADVPEMANAITAQTALPISDETKIADAAPAEAVADEHEDVEMMADATPIMEGTWVELAQEASVASAESAGVPPADSSATDEAATTENIAADDDQADAPVAEANEIEAQEVPVADEVEDNDDVASHAEAEPDTTDAEQAAANDEPDPSEHLTPAPELAEVATLTETQPDEAEDFTTSSAVEANEAAKVEAESPVATETEAATQTVSDEAEAEDETEAEPEGVAFVAETPEVEDTADQAGDTIPVQPKAAIEREGDAPARTGILNSTVVLPPLDHVDYVNRHRPAWLDSGDLGSLPGVALDPGTEPDAPVAKSPSVPSMGALTVSSGGPAPTQVGDIPPTEATGEPMMDLADLAGLAEPTTDAADEDAAAPPKTPRAFTRPLPKIDRDIMDTPRER